MMLRGLGVVFVPEHRLDARKSHIVTNIREAAVGCGLFPMSGGCLFSAARITCNSLISGKINRFHQRAISKVVLDLQCLSWV